MSLLLPAIKLTLFLFLGFNITLVGGDASLTIKQDPSLEEVIDAVKESSFDSRSSQTTSESTSVHRYECVIFVNSIITYSSN